jgi:hypothetical protein
LFVSGIARKYTGVVPIYTSCRPIAASLSNAVIVESHQLAGVDGAGSGHYAAVRAAGHGFAYGLIRYRFDVAAAALQHCRAGPEQEGARLNLRRAGALSRQVQQPDMLAALSLDLFAVLWRAVRAAAHLAMTFWQNRPIGYRTPRPRGLRYVITALPPAGCQAGRSRCGWRFGLATIGRFCSKSFVLSLLCWVSDRGVRLVSRIVRP